MDLLTKQDIMKLFKCKSQKALSILKLLFQMGYGTKIGKEYYTTKNSLEEFYKITSGKEVVF